MPTLIIHGDDDQIVPIDIAGRRSAKLVKNATLKVQSTAEKPVVTPISPG